MELRGRCDAARGTATSVETQYLNWPTSSRSSVDICASCAAAFWESPAPCEVLCAASATPAMFFEISPAPRAASVTLRDISFVVAFCSSTAVAIVVGDVVDLHDHRTDDADGIDGALGVSLNGFDLAADVLGGLGGLLGKFFNFVGDHREALACFACPRGLDGGIERQEIGLLRDGSDDFDDLADFGAGYRPACLPWW